MRYFLWRHPINTHSYLFPFNVPSALCPPCILGRVYRNGMPLMIATKWRQKITRIYLKPPMPPYTQPKHCPAKHNGVFKVPPCPFNIFNNIWFPQEEKQLVNKPYQIRVLALRGYRRSLTVILARRACVNNVITIKGELQHISLIELEWVMGLWFNIHSLNLKASKVIPLTCPARTAE